MNHKRRRPKSSRAGCIQCKPWKDQRLKDSWGAQTRQEKIARIAEVEQRNERKTDS